MDRHDGLRWLLVSLLGFVAGQAIAIALVGLVAGALGHGTSLKTYAAMATPPEWYVLSSLLGLWTGFLSAAWFAARSRGGSLVEVLGLRVTTADLRYLLLGVVAQVVVALMYLPFQDHISHLDAPTKRLVGGSHGLGSVAVILATGVLAPFVEEVFFRGLVLRGIVAVLGRASGTLQGIALVVGVLLDGAIFAAAHFEPVQFAGLMALGCLLAVITLRQRRLGPAIATHVAFNLTALAFAFGSR